MHKLKIFLKLGLRKQSLFIQMFILSGYFRFLMLYLPFKYLKRRMGIANYETSYEVPNYYYYEARQIQKMVLLVCRYTPWESKCLVKALLVQFFLERKNIPTTLYLGINKDETSQMNAHAWIRCGNMVITGVEERHRFIEVAKFSNENL